MEQTYFRLGLALKPAIEGELRASGAGYVLGSALSDDVLERAGYIDDVRYARERAALLADRSRPFAFRLCAAPGSLARARLGRHYLNRAQEAFAR